MLTDYATLLDPIEVQRLYEMSLGFEISLDSFDSPLQTHLHVRQLLCVLKWYPMNPHFPSYVKYLWYLSAKIIYNFFMSSLSFPEARRSLSKWRRIFIHISSLSSFAWLSKNCLSNICSASLGLPVSYILTSVKCTKARPFKKIMSISGNTTSDEVVSTRNRTEACGNTLFLRFKGFVGLLEYLHLAANNFNTSLGHALFPLHLLIGWWFLCVGLIPAFASTPVPNVFFTIGFLTSDILWTVHNGISKVIDIDLDKYCPSAKLIRSPGCFSMVRPISNKHSRISLIVAVGSSTKCSFFQ